MISLSAPFVIVGLGSLSPKYFWNGQELRGVIRMFVYKGTSVSLTVADKSILPVDELIQYGIKVKEIK